MITIRFVATFAYSFYDVIFIIRVDDSAGFAWDRTSVVVVEPL
jgi:hypothetical protein